MNHPQKPRLVLRIGVTGHRPNRLSPEAPGLLKTEILRLLANARDTLGAVRTEYPGFFDDAPVRLIVVSSLAEGADSIVAEAARELDLELFCPLPFARAEYERDFKEPPARDAFHRLLN